MWVAFLGGEVLGIGCRGELALAHVAAEGVGDGFEGGGEDAHVGGVGAVHGNAAAGADAFIVPLLDCGKCRVGKGGEKDGAGVGSAFAKATA